MTHTHCPLWACPLWACPLWAYSLWAVGPLWAGPLPLWAVVDPFWAGPLPLWAVVDPFWAGPLPPWAVGPLWACPLWDCPFWASPPAPAGPALSGPAPAGPAPSGPPLRGTHTHAHNAIEPSLAPDTALCPTLGPHASLWPARETLVRFAYFVSNIFTILTRHPCLLLAPLLPLSNSWPSRLFSFVFCLPLPVPPPCPPGPTALASPGLPGRSRHLLPRVGADPLSPPWFRLRAAPPWAYRFLSDRPSPILADRDASQGRSWTEGLRPSRGTWE